MHEGADAFAADPDQELPASDGIRQSSSWLVVHCKPRQEQVALDNLSHQGFECYLPMCSVQKLRRGKVSVVTEPLFSRYLFLREPDVRTTSLSPVRSTRGVVRLVRFGEQPSKVPDSLVQALRAEEASHQHQPAPYLQPGEAVQVTSGPLQGLSGLFAMSDGEARAMVLIELMGRPLQVGVEMAHLGKAS